MNYFDLTVRVRYAETDQMGVVYYSNYLVWFEVARTEYFRALGLPYTRYEAQGIFLPVGEAHCRYHKPLRYDDEVVVRIWVSNMRRSSLEFSYGVYKKDDAEPVAEGTTTHVFVDKNMKPCRVPPEVRKHVQIIKQPPL